MVFKLEQDVYHVSLVCICMYIKFANIYIYIYIIYIYYVIYIYAKRPFTSPVKKEICDG